MHNKELWPFIFLLGLLVFNYPLMDLGKTALPYYLYGTWALLILVVGFLATIEEYRRKK